MHSYRWNNFLSVQKNEQMKYQLLIGKAVLERFYFYSQWPNLCGDCQSTENLS
jgi:hypothetical protein